MPLFNRGFENNPFFKNLTEEQKKTIETLMKDNDFMDRLMEKMTWETVADAGLMAILSIVEAVERTPEGRRLMKSELAGPTQYIIGMLLALGMKPFTNDPTIFAARMNYALETPNAHLARFNKRVRCNGKV